MTEKRKIEKKVNGHTMEITVELNSRSGYDIKWRLLHPRTYEVIAKEKRKAKVGGLRSAVDGCIAQAEQIITNRKKAREELGGLEV